MDRNSGQDFNMEQFIQQMGAMGKQPKEDYEPTRKTVAYSRKELKVEDITVAYVVNNPDGSFTQLKIHKTAVKAVWTSIIAETEKNKNSVTDMRLAPLDEWEDPNRRKRNVYYRGVTVQPNECLCKCLKRNPVDNPVLLVVWERLPSTPAHLANKNVCCMSKKWKIILFTNGTDTTKCKGGPIILVHTASGTAQLDESGIQTVASSAFIDWLQTKVQTEGWQIISLMPMAASVRVRS
jgi:hypothetical protein